MAFAMLSTAMVMKPSAASSADRPSPLSLASAPKAACTATVALRTGVGAGGIRADAEAGAVVVQDRAATCRHRMNQHHWRTHAYACDLRFEGALVLAVEMRHVGGSAPHVEADQAPEPGGPAGLRQ